MFEHLSYIWILPLSIAIPVFIHLFIKRRKKIVYLPTVRFLLELKENPRSKIEDLLNLLMRMGILSCLCFLFALPYVKKKGAGRLANAIAIFDSSPSVQACDEGFLKKTYEEALKFFRSTREAEIGLCSKELKFAGVEESYKEILNGNYTEDVRVCLESAPYPNVIFVSDFRGKGWKKFYEDVLNLPSPAFEGKKILFLPLKNCRGENYWISSAQAIEEDDGFFLTVIGGFKGISPHTIEVLNERREKISESSVYPEKGGFRSQIKLRGKIDAGLIFHLPDEDGIKSDNYFFLIPEKLGEPPSSFLIINGEPMEISYYDEAYYLLNAMRSDPHLWSRTKMVYAWEEVKKGPYPEVLFILNKSFGEDELNYLKGLLKKGGRIIFAPGDMNEGSRKHMEFLGVTSPGTRIFSLPATLRITSEGKDFFNPSEKFIRLLQNVNVKIQYEFVPEEDAHILLKTDEGLPFLLWMKKDGGEIFVFSVPLDIEWSDFALQPVFLPLIVFLATGEHLKKEKRLLSPEEGKPGIYRDEGGNYYAINPDLNDSALDEVDLREMVKKFKSATIIQDISSSLGFFSHEGDGKFFIDRILIFFLISFIIAEILLSRYHGG